MNKIIVVLIASLLIINFHHLWNLSEEKSRFPEESWVWGTSLSRPGSPPIVCSWKRTTIKEGIKRPRRRFAVGFGIWLDVLVERGRLKHCVTQNGTIPIPPELSIYFDDHSNSRPADVLAAELEDEEETSHHEMDIDAGVDVDEELTKQKYELFVYVLFQNKISVKNVKLMFLF